MRIIRSEDRMLTMPVPAFDCGAAAPQMPPPITLSREACCTVLYCTVLNCTDAASNYLISVGMWPGVWGAGHRETAHTSPDTQHPRVFMDQSPGHHLDTFFQGSHSSIGISAADKDCKTVKSMQNDSKYCYSTAGAGWMCETRHT